MFQSITGQYATFQPTGGARRYNYGSGGDMRVLIRHLFLIGTLGFITLAALSFARPRVTAANAAAAAEPGDPPLIDLAGYNQLIAGSRGKAVMVNFWATWCEPCRNEFPGIISLSKEYGSQGLVVIGVSLDADSDMNLVRHFLSQSHADFPNFREKPGIDADAFYHGVNPDWHGTLPYTDFYARDGHLARYFVGDHPRDAFVEAIRLILAVPVGGNQPRKPAVAGN
jgi:thiol-disulfide isomerase/thioredoxin